MARIKVARRLGEFGCEQDVWNIFTPLSIKHKSINLGQGFPNIPAHPFVKNAACDAIQSDLNQYAPSRGLHSLISSLSSLYSPSFQRTLSAQEILINQGANQAINIAMMTFIDEGDEVLLLEPYFDIYKGCILMAGGVPIGVPLRRAARMGGDWSDGVISSSQWKLDLSELEQIVGPKTKAIILNTPHNPTGKVFDEQELQEIASFTCKHNLLMIADEVFDQLFYTRQAPTKIATLDGMWERTLTVGSGGKMLGVTGWRIGWTIGEKNLIDGMLKVHSQTVFTSPTPFQQALANSIDWAVETGWMAENRKEYVRLREKLIKALTDAGIPCTRPDGSYFILANLEGFSPDLSNRREDEPNDWKLCRWMTEQIGITAIPPSAFYQPKWRGECKWLVRLCFCKDDKTLDEAAKRLLKMKRFKSKS